MKWILVTSLVINGYGVLAEKSNLFDTRYECLQAQKNWNSAINLDKNNIQEKRSSCVPTYSGNESLEKEG